jgi:hypothetical protein
MNLKPTNSLNRTTFPLLEVAYAPSFHLNLLSANRAADAGLHLRGRDYILKEEDRTLVCRLNRKASIYLIKWDSTTSDGLPKNSGIHSVNHVKASHVIPTIPSVSHVIENHVIPEKEDPANHVICNGLKPGLDHVKHVPGSHTKPQNAQ